MGKDVELSGGQGGILGRRLANAFLQLQGYSPTGQSQDTKPSVLYPSRDPNLITSSPAGTDLLIVNTGLLPIYVFIRY